MSNGKSKSTVRESSSSVVRASSTEKGTKTGVGDRHPCYHIPAGKAATILTEERAIYRIAEQREKQHQLCWV